MMTSGGISVTDSVGPDGGHHIEIFIPGADLRRGPIEDISTDWMEDLQHVQGL